MQTIEGSNYIRKYFQGCVTFAREFKSRENFSFEVVFLFQKGSIVKRKISYRMKEVGAGLTGIITYYTEIPKILHK